MKTSIYRKIFRLTVAILLTNTYTDAQLLNSWGLKLGFNSIHTVASNDGIQSQLISRTGLALGGFLEAFDSGHFNLLTEIDFIQKGEKMEIPLGSGNADEVAEMTTQLVTINNLSILMLGKVHFNAGGIRIYGLVGPRFDVAISKSIALHASDSTESLFNPIIQSELKQYKDSQFGITMGAGVQSDNILPCGIGAEIRFSPDFTHTFDIPFLYNTKSQSWEFLLVLNF